MNSLNLFMTGTAAAVAAENVRARLPTTSTQTAGVTGVGEALLQHKRAAVTPPEGAPSVDKPDPIRELNVDPTSSPADRGSVAPAQRSRLIVSTVAAVPGQRVSMPLFAAGPDPEIGDDIGVLDEHTAVDDAGEDIDAPTTAVKVRFDGVQAVPPALPAPGTADEVVPASQTITLAPAFDLTNGPVTFSIVAAPGMRGSSRMFLLSVRAYNDEASPISVQFEVADWTRADSLCAALEPALTAALTEYLAAAPGRAVEQASRVEATPEIKRSGEVTADTRQTAPAKKPTKAVSKPPPVKPPAVDVLTLF